MQPKDKAPTLTVMGACARMGVAYTTFLLWERQGFAPRRVKVGARLRVPLDELTAWEDQRARDRLAIGKPWLRKPLEALSWTPEAKSAAMFEAIQQAGRGHAATA